MIVANIYISMYIGALSKSGAEYSFVHLFIRSFIHSFFYSFAHLFT